MKPLSLLALLVLPLPVAAQQICPSASGPGRVPPCMTGYWTGSSDMAEKLDLLFRNLPDNVFASGRPSSAQFLFLHVAEDGWFATSPMAAAADATIFTDAVSSGGAFVANLEASMESEGGTGFFTTGAGDALGFCMIGGSWGSVTISGEGGSSTSTMGSVATHDVPMRQTCSGDRLMIYVDLPDPMGTVTYALDRIPAAAVPGIAGILPPRD